MCQTGAPFWPKGQVGSSVSLSWDGAPGISGTIAQRPGVNSLGSSQSKYGRQSAISLQSSPRRSADCQNENAPLSKHDVGAMDLYRLHIVRPKKRDACRSACERAN